MNFSLKYQRCQHNKSYTRCHKNVDTQVIRKNINNTIMEEQHGNWDGKAQLQYQIEGIQTTYIAGQSGTRTNCIQRVYTTVYPYEEPILGTSGSPTTSSNQQMYGEELRQQKEHHRDPLHAIGPGRGRLTM